MPDLDFDEAGIRRRTYLLETIPPMISAVSPRLSRRSAAARILAGFAIVVLSLAGWQSEARAEAPTAYMQRVANELIAASRSGSSSAFSAVLRSHADVPWLGISSLGNYANALPAGERPTYYNGMINFLGRYAAKEAPKYAVASGVVTGVAGETKAGVEVDSRLTLKNGDTYDIRWLLVRRGQGFKVRDAQVLGFWMSPFLKNLFENYIAENGGNPRALVVALNR